MLQDLTDIGNGFQGRSTDLGEDAAGLGGGFKLGLDGRDFEERLDHGGALPAHRRLRLPGQQGPDSVPLDAPAPDAARLHRVSTRSLPHQSRGSAGV